MCRILPATLACALILPYTLQARAAQRNPAEEKALDAIQSLGARVAFDGKDPAGSVVRVNFYGTKVTDKGLSYLKGLPQLKSLFLGRTKITDAGLVHLAGLAQLKELDLYGTEVSSAGLVHLGALPQLQSLNLMGTKVTDAGLAHLTGLAHLEDLDLCATKVTDAGLVHLGHLPRLRSLQMDGGITDSGLSSLKGMSQLQTLDLTGSEVTDAGLAHLEPLTELQSLELGHTAITDAGLRHLKGLTRLRSLDLSATEVTGAGMAHLGGLVRLKSLNLLMTSVGDDGLAYLPALTDLESLNLAFTRVTEAGVERLKALPKLKTVDLVGSGAEGAARFWRPHPPERSGVDERPEQFVVAACLELPEPPWVNRSMAIRAPWVYVLGEEGDLRVFRIPENSFANLGPKIKPVRVLRNVGDGCNLMRWDDVLVCTWFGNLEVYSLADPQEPKRLGRWRTASKRNYSTEAIVRDGNRAFVLGYHVILTYDLSQPSSPKPLAEQTTEYDACAGCVAAGHLYVGGSKTVGSKEQHGIAVLDVANGAHLKEVAFLPMSQAVYHVFALPGKRLLASLDGDSLVNDPGKVALLDVADPAHPVLLKETRCGGRAATMMSTKEGPFFVCRNLVSLIRGPNLFMNFSFDCQRGTCSGLPYRGDSDGTYAALPLDEEAIVLRVKTPAEQRATQALESVGALIEECWAR
ncbi:MAG: leucine-rich repeat domain-containing protein [Pirellulales bacterium]